MCGQMMFQETIIKAMIIVSSFLETSWGFCVVAI